MKKLLEHIEKLLLVHDCVIVPNFGGFVAIYEPVKFVSDKNLLTPPARKIGFNIHLKHNDGLLAQVIMKAENCSYERATKKINRQIELIFNTLENERQLNFGNIGHFLMNEKGIIIFEPNNAFISTPQYFGLKSIHIQTINKKQPIHKSVWQYAAIALLALLLLPANLLDNQHAEQASFITFNWNTEVLPETKLPDETLISDSLVSISDTLPLHQLEKVAQISEYFFYHIIIASLPNERLASQYQQEVKNYFSNTEVIKGEKRCRVSIKTFIDKSEADEFLAEFQIKNPKFASAWILEDNFLR